MDWITRLSDRLLGYAHSGSWRLYPVAEREQAERGLPERIPVPREVWRAWSRGERPQRLPHRQIAAFAERFACVRPRHRLRPVLERFARKAPAAARAEEALQQQSWEEGALALGEVLEIDASDARAWALRGFCLQRLGRLEEAQEAHAEAERHGGETADLVAFRGELAELRGHADDARRAYRRALELEEGHALALAKLAQLGELVEIYLGDLDHPEKAYLPVDAYEQVITEGWDKAPQTLAFYLERSDFHLRHGQPSLALKAAERGRAILEQEAAEGPLAVSGRTSAVAARCRALIALERTEEAAQAVAQLQQLAPNGEATLSCWGQLLWLQNQRAQAAAVVLKAIEANPNRLENLQLFLRPEFPRAERDPIRALDQLLEKYPQAASMLALAGSLAMAAEQWDRGVSLAREAARLGVDDELLLDLTGRMGRHGLHREVVDLIDLAGGWESFRGRHAMLRVNLAASLHATGQGDLARVLWQSVVDDADAHPEVRLRARRLLADSSGDRIEGPSR